MAQTAVTGMSIRSLAQTFTPAIFLQTVIAAFRIEFDNVAVGMVHDSTTLQ
jgi:hypothetical protein